jgi:peptidoglycan hydrolase CwlO-like protein
MSDLERKKLEVQLKRIDATIAELEFKIDERKEDIRRIEEHILLQKEQETEIKQKLN